MKIKITLLGLLMLLAAGVFADGITKEAAKQVAKNIYYERADVKQTDIVFSEEITVRSGDTPIYYVFNVDKEKGFVIISADDAANPLIGYGLKNRFETEGQPLNVSSWMKRYYTNIQYIKENDIEATPGIENQWKKYNVAFDEFTPQKGGAKVDALTDHLEWNQDEGWNDYCPTDPGGSGGHAYAGCVSTAMSIMMKYHEYPTTGYGSHSYNHPSYGTLSADFANANYDYSNMNNSSPTSNSAELMYHCGVAVQMDYGPDGSSAYNQDVPDAMWYYFLYELPTHHFKDDYGKSEWNSLLKADLDNGMPLIYGGQSDDGGHAFVCDGYDEYTENWFSFNFGWGGYNNGFYDITSSDFEYPYDQECINGIKPDNIGIRERENFVGIYPNPSDGIFHVKTKEKVLEIQVYNYAGQNIQPIYNEHSVDLSNYPNGIYFLRITTKNKQMMQKVIKN